MTKAERQQKKHKKHKLKTEHEEYYDFSFDYQDYNDYLKFGEYIVDLGVEFLNASVGAASANTSVCEENILIARDYYDLV